MPAENSLTNDYYTPLAKNKELIQYWITRLILDASGYEHMDDYYYVAEPIGWIKLFIPSPGDKVEKQDIFCAIKSKRKELDRQRPQLSEVLRNNLRELSALVGLNKTDGLVLTFAALMSMVPPLRQVATHLGELNHLEVVRILGIVLERPFDEIEDALGPKGTLTVTGIAHLDTPWSADLPNILEVMAGLPTALLSRKGGIKRLLEAKFHKGSSPHLTKADFDYVNLDLEIIRNHLNGSASSERGAPKFLVYGRPGTGKTEFARMLASLADYDLYEIANNNDGEPLEGKERLKAFNLAQHALAHRSNSLILFDEVEEVFPVDGFALFFGLGADIRPRKSWINRTLEATSVASIWVANRIDQMDEAYIRRFDYILELTTPPLKQRLKIVHHYTRDLDVTDGWRRSIAEATDTPPSLLEQAARVTKSTIVKSAFGHERIFKRTLNNSLVAMGYQKIQSALPEKMGTYRPDLLNADIDLNNLLEGLKKSPDGRLCLYGPPGTGKTRFAHYIAEEIDRPLLRICASDLLNEYVGGTEKRIRNMFESASRDGSVLLLDEADSFLRNREQLMNHWEVTQINELLTQMESFSGTFICSTNLYEMIDMAAIRRFDLKVKFGYLSHAQAWELFKQTLENESLSSDQNDKYKNKLKSIDRLTPGDFANVIRQSRWNPIKLTADSLYEQLFREVKHKSKGIGSGIGFI